MKLLLSNRALLLGLALPLAPELAWAQSTPNTQILPEGVLSAPAAAHYPDEEMLDVGGRKVQILRGGQGSATVVFESGLGHGIAAWDRVRPEVNKFASTLCYSRAGISPSDEAPPGPRSALAIADDLHVLLGRAGLKPPYILVGHSYGGASMRIYAIKYPGEVAGLVLVDPQTEGMVVRARSIDPRMASSQLALLSDADRKRLPPGFVQEFDGSTAMWATGDLGISGKLPQIPFALITSLKTSYRDGPEADPDIRLKRQLQSEIFQGMDYGMHIVTDRSSHDIMQSEPGLVITSIRFVLDAAAHPPKAKPRPVAIVLSAAQIAPLLGDYVDPKGNRISVVADGGSVFLQSAGQPKKEILAESETRFFMTDNLDARLIFEKNPVGQITSASLEIGKVKIATLRRAPLRSMVSPAGNSACLNCGAPLRGPYCSQCGQHDVDYHRSLKFIAEDALEGFLHFDGKFLATVRYLFTRPGFLTTEFLAGRRVRYVPPLRFYLFASFLALFVVSFAPVRFNPGPDGPASIRSAADWRSLFRPEVLQSQEFVARIHHLLPIALFICVPLLALLLRWAFGRSHRFYVSHLIFALHVQAFFLLVTLGDTVGGWFFSKLGAIEMTLFRNLLWLCVLYVFYRALRTVYGQGRATTVVKLMAVGVPYAILVAIATGASIVLSARLSS